MSNTNNLMKPYFDLLAELRTNGKQLKNQRTGEICYYKSSAHLEFDGSKGFLANTRRKIGIEDKDDPSKFRLRGPVGELLGFFRGYTNAADFEKVGTKVWYANANGTEAWLKNPWRKGENDNGLIYQFKEVIDRCVVTGEAERDFYIQQGYEVELQGQDGRYCMARPIRQLDNLLKTLLTNPTDRRMIVTALHVGTFDKCSLPPCHHTYSFTWNADNSLDIECSMRSWDCHLAFNLQLTHLFLCVVCRLVGMTPGKVCINATNAHLYGSSLAAVDEVLTRDDFEAPTLVLSENIQRVTLETYKGAFDRIEPDDIWLENYQSHAAIKTEMVK